MHIALGASLLATKRLWAPEVEKSYARARQLCQYLGDPYRLFPVLRVWHYYHVRAEYQTAHAAGEQLLTLAQQSQDSAMLVAAHRALGATLFQRELSPLRTHYAQGMVRYDPQQHRVYAFLYRRTLA